MAEQSLSYLVLLVLPMATYVVLNLNGVANNTSIFSAICLGCVTLWLFAPVPDFVPAMLALLLLLLFDLAPENITLSGFSSPIFILAFSLMGIGLAVVRSGLAIRTGAFLLRHLPANRFFQQCAMLIVGFLYQSFTLSDNKREKIILPMLNSILETRTEIGLAKKNVMLTTTSQDAVNFFSPLLLTAAPANFFVLAFLSNQNQSLFTFSFWLYACSVTTLLMFVLYLILSSWYWKPLQKVVLTEKSMSEYFQSPGAFSSMERMVLMAIGVLLLGISTQNIHQQPLSHLCFGVLVIILLVSGNHWKYFISKINWDFLLLLACASGVFAVMEYLQLDALMISQLTWLSQFIAQQFAIFVMLLTILIVMARQFMSEQVVALIFCFVLLPLSVFSGINPWLLGLIVLLFTSIRVFSPYQKSYVVGEREAESIPAGFQEGNKFQVLLLLLRYIVIYLSIPFWQVTGFL